MVYNSRTWSMTGEESWEPEQNFNPPNITRNQLSSNKTGNQVVVNMSNSDSCVYSPYKFSNNGIKSTILPCCQIHFLFLTNLSKWIWKMLVIFWWCKVIHPQTFPGLWVRRKIRWFDLNFLMIHFQIICTSLWNFQCYVSKNLCDAFFCNIFEILLHVIPIICTPHLFEIFHFYDEIRFLLTSDESWLNWSFQSSQKRFQRYFPFLYHW